MRAARYIRAGSAEVLEVVEMADPEPGPGQVRVRMAVAGVNPTDWKRREADQMPFGFQIPGQDGAGTIDRVGDGVDAGLIGERVWLWLVADGNPFGTAAEFSVVPVHQAVPMAADASFDVGAALGVPFLTAHRCLTVAESGPGRLHPGALDGAAVLVQGGAGAVGNAAIQLAKWADATVIATVSSPAKAQLARSAGADHVIDYRQQDVATEVRKLAPAGVDTVVEVDAANVEADLQVLAMHGVIASYAADPDTRVTLPVRNAMQLNARWQFVLLYTVPEAALRIAVADVARALATDVLQVGEDAGLPLLRYPLDQTAAAQQAVQDGAVGKVLVDIATS